MGDHLEIPGAAGTEYWFRDQFCSDRLKPGQPPVEVSHAGVCLRKSISKEKDQWGEKRPSNTRNALNGLSEEKCL